MDRAEAEFDGPPGCPGCSPARADGRRRNEATVRVIRSAAGARVRQAWSDGPCSGACKATRIVHRDGTGTLGESVKRKGRHPCDRSGDARSILRISRYVESTRAGPDPAPRCRPPCDLDRGNLRQPDPLASARPASGAVPRASGNVRDGEPAAVIHRSITTGGMAGQATTSWCDRIVETDGRRIVFAHRAARLQLEVRAGHGLMKAFYADADECDRIAAERR